MTWDVEIGATGEYEIQLYYACAKSDVGAKIELSLGDARAATKIVDANDPPLVGADDDRSPRTESYVKDFRPISLGSMNLTKGQTGTLTLRATDIPGDEAMEFRLLMFHRRTAN